MSYLDTLDKYRNQHNHLSDQQPNMSTQQPDLTLSPTVDSQTTTTTTTAPPARGAEMRNFLQARLQKNRSPPLVHSWDFWHDRQDRAPSSSNNQTQTQTQPSSPGTPSSQAATSPTDYSARLIPLARITSISTFWSLFNNFDTTQLPLRDSIHLFKLGVKPIWEDPRNAHGGAWTFRIPKHQAPEFWKEICMLAIGEALQACVEEEQGVMRHFKDDICGVSLGVRYGSVLVQVWNRDAGHEEGVRRVLECVLGSVDGGLRPREGSYYYKRHAEHAAFAAGAGERESAGAV